MLAAASSINPSMGCVHACAMHVQSYSQVCDTLWHPAISDCCDKLWSKAVSPTIQSPSLGLCHGFTHHQGGAIDVAHTTSRNRHTPASVHFIQGCLLRSWAVNTSCLNRVSVRYTGHWYTSRSSALSTGTARTCARGCGTSTCCGHALHNVPA